MPGHIFQVVDSPCGIFAPRDGDGAQILLSFARAAHLLSARPPTQGADGSILASYVPIGTFSVDFQPKSPSFPRYIGGVANTIEYVAFAPGQMDIHVGDRCYVPAFLGENVYTRQLEVIGVLHYGQEHTEIELKTLAR